MKREGSTSSIKEIRNSAAIAIAALLSILSFLILPITASAGGDGSITNVTTTLPNTSLGSAPLSDGAVFSFIHVTGGAYPTCGWYYDVYAPGAPDGATLCVQWGQFGGEWVSYPNLGHIQTNMYRGTPTAGGATLVDGPRYTGNAGGMEFFPLSSSTILPNGPYFVSAVVRNDTACDTYWTTGAGSCGHNLTYSFTVESATTTPVCTENCNSNVLFLPGIEASRLYRPQVVGDPEKRLWEPYGDADALELAMNPDGTSVRDDIYTRDILDNAYVPFKGDVYKSFIGDMNALKNENKIEDWQAAPYDWRLSLEDIITHGMQTGDIVSYLGRSSTPYIEKELRRLASSSRTHKVTIIAHSNGGLVAKALITKLGTTTAEQLIDKVIFVGVPQTGTPKAIGAILHGFEQSLPVSWFPLALSADTARTMAQNMPGAYNLIPSFQYFTYADDNVITFDDSVLLAPWRAKYGNNIHSSDRLRTFMTDSSRPVLPVAEAIKNPVVANPILFTNAEMLHNTELDTWIPPSGIKIIEIAGWGEDTLKTIHYYQGTAGTCTERRADSTCAAIMQTPVLDYQVERVIDGDGTVVVPSALWTTGSERYWVNLKKYNDGLFGVRIDREHAGLLEIPELRTLLETMMANGSTSALPDFISAIQPVADPSDDRLHFTLHSPLSLHLYDDLGNHTGISTSTGFLEENIPGSRYERFGGITYATAPASTTIHVIMHGTAEGSFTLDVEETNGGVTVASTTFAGIPSSTTTIATLTIPQGGGIASSSPLTVDENGDGNVDLILASEEGGVSLPDITPPEAVFTFSTTTDDILVFGSDEGSVSVSPSPVLATSTLQYTITDDSGNTTTLSFKRIKEKESKNERHGHIKAQLLAIRYGTLSTTTESVFSKNEIQYEWEYAKDGSLKEMMQEVKVKKDVTLRAKYDAKKDETKIYFVDKENKEKLKETRQGLVSILIATREGELVVEY
ncbi:hypothetical protein HZC00_00320 [Candidatus Kaiserbacteria bacterium]|nr:hypothetical protein [Candidatus Kaiserbacteria bacterium]